MSAGKEAIQVRMETETPGGGITEVPDGQGMAKEATKVAIHIWRIGGIACSS